AAARDPSQAARLGSDLAARVESRHLTIKRLIRRVLGLPAEVRVPRGQHDLTRDAISPATAKVCAALREAGFSGYVVGGAVRDLLLGITPKDFDVATDARPEQVRPLFRRAIIIGRRFRLVHVMLGAETIEVSTFRAADPVTGRPHTHAAGGAARGKAGPHARPGDARADPRAGSAPRTHAAGAPVRRDAEAAAFRARQRLPAPAARRRAAQGRTAAARRHSRAAARGAVRDPRARTDRRAGARRAPGIAGFPVRGVALA